jgi:mannose-6-phosphate isomerase-like protein (cupin superfamily)
MTRFDLAQLEEEPESPIGRFDFHGCQCGVASFTGRPPWELHSAGDELLFIPDGESELTVLEPGGHTTRTISAGQLVVVPQGCWHTNKALVGVTLLYVTPVDGNEHSWEESVQSEA